MTLSHGANVRRPGRSRFHDEFDWTGTADITACLSIPTAIDFLGGQFSGGWPYAGSVIGSSRSTHATS